MADKFLATNKKNSRQLFEERTVYKLDAFEVKPGSVYGNEALKDFWENDNSYYGRLDTQQRIILPKSSRLRNIKASSNTGLYALDFVADAWLHLKETADNKINEGCLPLENTDGSEEVYIGPFEPTRAYRNLTNQYSKNMRVYMIAYERQYLKKRDNYDKVLNFQDFLSSFNYFMINSGAGHLVYTLSNMMLSPNASVLNTGLAIDISNLDAGDDTVKEDNFINNPRLNFYKNIAQEYGFYIDRNVPWRFVANLASSPMEKYITNRFPGYSGLDSLFEEYYDHATGLDIELMKNTMLNFYNSFAARRRFEVVEVRKGMCKTTTTFRRESVSREFMDEIYPNSYWLSLYIAFRNLESSINYEKAELDKIIKNAIDLEKAVDMEKAMEYINYKFGGLTSVPRSFAYDSLADSLVERGLSSKEKTKVVELAAQSENLIVY
tara:strand:+ start:2431 stop:3741 length:1311 start_codon:yes stop_codon:yes gene_type:complete